MVLAFVNGYSFTGRIFPFFASFLLSRTGKKYFLLTVGHVLEGIEYYFPVEK